MYIFNMKVTRHCLFRKFGLCHGNQVRKNVEIFAKVCSLKIAKD